MKAKTAKIEMVVETVTPETAGRYLATNIGHQRNVSNSHVIHLSQQMEAGQWQMNGEPVIFDREGALVDGQHRMMAIIRSGKSIEMMIVRGVATESFLTINRGKSRTSGNLFTIAGFSNGNDLAAATANVINYRRAMKVKDMWMEKEKNGDGAKSKKSFNPGSLNSYIRASGADMIEEYEKNKDAYEVAMVCARARKQLRLVPPSVISTVAALAMIETGHKEAEVLFFWESFANGTGENGMALGSKDPIFVLREKCVANVAAKSKYSKNMLIMLAIKAWNAYVTGKAISILRVQDGEPCPTIV